MSFPERSASSSQAISDGAILQSLASRDEDESAVAMKPEDSTSQPPPLRNSLARRYDGKNRTPLDASRKYPSRSQARLNPNAPYFRLRSLAKDSPHGLDEDEMPSDTFQPKEDIEKPSAKIRLEALVAKALSANNGLTNGVDSGVQDVSGTPTSCSENHPSTPPPLSHELSVANSDTLLSKDTDRVHDISSEEITGKSALQSSVQAQDGDIPTDAFSTPDGRKRDEPIKNDDDDDNKSHWFGNAETADNNGMNEMHLSHKTYDLFMQNQTALSTSATVQQLLYGMEQIGDLVHDYHDYISAQYESSKPLYQWTGYKGYDELKRACAFLAKTTSHMKLVDRKGDGFSQKESSLWFNRALHLSTVVSDHAVFAMSIASLTLDMSAQELGNSSLTSEAKNETRRTMTKELENMLKHLTNATQRVYVALDLLQKVLLADKVHGNGLPVTTTMSSHPRTIWTKRLVIFIAVLVSAALGAFVKAYTGHVMPPKAILDVEGLIKDVEMREKPQYDALSSRLSDFDEHTKRLEAFQGEQSQRIDNLWEALGPPNSDGTYYSTKDCSCRGPEDIERRLNIIEAQATKKIRELEEKIQETRRQWQRADIRLTQRLSKVERKA